MILSLALLQLNNSAAEVNVTKLNSDYYLTELGRGFIVENYHTFIYSIPLKPIDEILEKVKFNVAEFRHFLRDPVYEDHFNLVNNEIKEIENVLLNLEKHRNKRGLLNFVGEIQNYLYGTMSDSDREEIYNNLQILRKNQNLINDQFSKSKTILTSVINRIDNVTKQINSNLENMSDQINAISKITTVQRKLFLLNLQISEIHRYVDKIEKALKYSQIHILDFGFITHTDFIEMIDSVKYKIPFENTNNYFQIIYTGGYLFHDEIIIIIKVPMIKEEGSYGQIIPIKRNGQICQLENFHYFKNYQLNLINECHQLEKLYICKNNVKPLKSTCNYFQTKENWEIELENGEIIVESDKDQIIKCGISVYKITGSNKINFKNCTLEIGNKQYFNPIYKNYSMLEINVTKVELLKFKLNPIQNMNDMLKELNELGPVKLEEVNFSSKHHVLVWIIFSIILIIICICFFYYIKNNKSITVKSKIQKQVNNELDTISFRNL